MTLTLKTAKHAIDRNGEVFKIVEHYGDPTELATGIVTRNEAEDIGDYDRTFKPCIAVTNAREALDAAWELAYEPEDGVIPPVTKYIRREHEDGVLSLSRLANAISAKDPHGERRLLDAPEPEPEPEPWELSRYCHADGEIYGRFYAADSPYWLRPGSATRYSRAYLAERNPKPVTIEHKEEA